MYLTYVCMRGLVIVYLTYVCMRGLVIEYLTLCMYVSLKLWKSATIFSLMFYLFTILSMGKVNQRGLFTNFSKLHSKFG